MIERVMSAAGIVVIIGLCVLLSRERSRISWRVVGWGVGLQLLFGLLILKTRPDAFFAGAKAFFDKIYFFADSGAAFLFGQLAQNPDFVLLKLASVVIFVASLMSVLYYLRVIQVFVYVFARIMQWTMRVSGAESLGAAMFVLMGIEAVTGLKRYITGMTRSELFTLMVGFMATIAGSVMAAYVGIFGASAGHILAASVMSAPAAIMLSKLLEPETEEPETAGLVEWSSMRPPDDNIVEAAANGAIDGVKLTAFIGAMLLAFIALINMLDWLLGFAHTSFGALGGYVFAPVAFLLGVPWTDCMEAGRLLAIKVFFNEWISYDKLSVLRQSGAIGPRATMIVTYALCSFANFGSLGILIGGIGGLAPERRSEVARMGSRPCCAACWLAFSPRPWPGCCCKNNGVAFPPYNIRRKRFSDGMLL